MNKIKWSPYRSDNQNDDMCGIYQGKFIDITQDFQGHWSVIWNHKRFNKVFQSKSEAKQWAEHHANSCTLSDQDVVIWYNQ